MTPRIVRTSLAREELADVVRDGFGDMAKVVADIERRVLALGGSLHADGEALLLDDGSRQEDLWGANVYPEQSPEQRIEFTSLINIRPRQGNRVLEIQDENIRAAVADVIRVLLPL